MKGSSHARSQSRGRNRRVRARSLGARVRTNARTSGPRRTVGGFARAGRHVLVPRDRAPRPAKSARRGSAEAATDRSRGRTHGDRAHLDRSNVTRWFLPAILALALALRWIYVAQSRSSP